MNRVRLVHRGVLTAHGFIIDVPTIGGRDARRRVLAWRDAGTRLHLLDDGRWLMALGDPVGVRAEAAPGLPLAREAGRLVGAADLDGEGSGDLVAWTGGEIRAWQLADLPVVDPVDWIDLSPLAVHRLQPVVAPAGGAPGAPGAGPPPEALPPPRPDLRAAARVGPPSAATREAAAALGAATRPATRPGGRSGGLSGAARATGRGRAGGRPPPAKPGSSALAKLLLRSPLQKEIGRRHAKYLEELSRDFRNGNVLEALHRAIPMGGLGSVGLTLRVPTRRESIEVSPTAHTGGRSVPLDGTVQDHLRELYRQAATELEAAGRIDEAAYVLADLLDAPIECVELLERHRRFELAAILADGRDLDPAMVVRLWWLAGNRARAVMHAVHHAAFAAAIARLGDADPDLARELRRQWVAHLEAAGDLFGAVEAGWPDPQLRPVLLNVIERGIAFGGPDAGALRAYRLALQPSKRHREDALDFFTRDEPALGPARESFTVTLAESRGPDPVLDREMTTVALRWMIGAEVSLVGKRFDKVQNELRQRADRVFVADLPATRHTSRGGPRQAGGAFPSISVLPPGQAPVLDAVHLGSGSTLVALGELGVRLLTPDGRTAARWDIPTHQFVVADHGKAVLLITRRATVAAAPGTTPTTAIEVHRLDLVARQVRHYGSLRLLNWTTCFDGAQWITVDDRGIAVFDVAAATPRVNWRELEPQWRCLRIRRSASSLAAIIFKPPDAWGATARLELWSWTLPAMRLQQRVPTEWPGDGELDVRANGTPVRLDGDPATGALTLTTGANEQSVISSEARARVVIDGDEVGLVLHAGTPGAVVQLYRRGGGTAPMVPVDGASIAGMRSHGDVITVFDDLGRLTAIDPAGQVLNQLRVRLA